jgi:ABC-type transporter Mla maintaining outer membrane lipid asymmetry permease subunit MlaE
VVDEDRGDGGGRAEGVGVATTQSVVHALLAILVANAILTALFFFL